MKFRVWHSAFLLFFITSILAAQTPTTVPNAKPSLRRDRTQKVLYPKIIEFEDERMVTPELLDLLTLNHGGVKRRVILALGRIGYPTGIAALVGTLNSDPNAEIRALAAFALGEIESHFAVTALLERLQPEKEPSDEVRARAIEALGKIAANRLSAEALTNYGVKGIATTLVAYLPSTAEPPNEAQKLMASMTLTALLRIRQPATVEPIMAQLRSPDGDLRWQAANALARIREGIAPAVPSLLSLLDDKNTLARAQAARALGVAKDKSAVAPLLKLLNDADENVVINAINALAAIGDERAADPLLALGNRLLDGYRTFNRAKEGVPTQQNQLLLIASALGNLKSPQALPFLKAYRFADGYLGSSPEIEIAVAKFGEAAYLDIPATISLPKENWRAMRAYAQGLGQLSGEKAKAILLDLLSGMTYGKPDARAISDILSALTTIKAPEIKDILLAHLLHEDVIVRATSARLLGESNDAATDVVKALKDAYQAARKDTLNDARIAIIEALNKLKQPINAETLSGETRDADFVVRLKAAELLRQSPAEAPTTRLQIGKVETKRDKAYYKRIGLLSTSGKNPTAVIHTKKGSIRFELFASDAPMTVDNFIRLARQGFYNGLAFVRVVPNFVVQAGDNRGDQNGGSDYQIRCEINYHRYGIGTLGMALSGKDTGSSQFFITHSPQPHLDGGYTVFGQVTSGMEVVQRIARDDIIERIEIIEAK